VRLELLSQAPIEDAGGVFVQPAKRNSPSLYVAQGEDFHATVLDESRLGTTRVAQRTGGFLFVAEEHLPSPLLDEAPLLPATRHKVATAPSSFAVDELKVVLFDDPRPVLSQAAHAVRLVPRLFVGDDFATAFEDVLSAQPVRASRVPRLPPPISLPSELGILFEPPPSPWVTSYRAPRRTNFLSVEDRPASVVLEDGSNTPSVKMARALRPSRSFAIDELGILDEPRPSIHVRAYRAPRLPPPIALPSELGILFEPTPSPWVTAYHAPRLPQHPVAQDDFGVLADEPGSLPFPVRHLVRTSILPIEDRSTPGALEDGFSTSPVKMARPLRLPPPIALPSELGILFEPAPSPWVTAYHAPRLPPHPVAQDDFGVLADEPGSPLVQALRVFRPSRLPLEEVYASFVADESAASLTTPTASRHPVRVSTFLSEERTSTGALEDAFLTPPVKMARSSRFVRTFVLDELGILDEPRPSIPVTAYRAPRLPPPIALPSELGILFEPAPSPWVTAYHAPRLPPHPVAHDDFGVLADEPGSPLALAMRVVRSALIPSSEDFSSFVVDGDSWTPSTLPRPLVRVTILPSGDDIPFVLPSDPPNSFPSRSLQRVSLETRSSTEEHLTPLSLDDSGRPWQPSIAKTIRAAILSSVIDIASHLIDDGKPLFVYPANRARVSRAAPPEDFFPTAAFFFYPVVGGGDLPNDGSEPYYAHDGEDWAYANSFSYGERGDPRYEEDRFFGLSYEPEVTFVEFDRKIRASMAHEESRNSLRVEVRALASAIHARRMRDLTLGGTLGGAAYFARGTIASPIALLGAAYYLWPFGRGLSPEHEEIFKSILVAVQDPQELRELADAFREYGAKDQAEFLERRAGFFDSKPEVLAEYKRIFRAAMAAAKDRRKHAAVLEVADAFHERGAVELGDRLREAVYAFRG
jgi:hypothetical protein